MGQILKGAGSGGPPRTASNLIPLLHTTVWKEAIHSKKWRENFPAIKLLCYSWPRCGSLTFVAIYRITGYQF